MQHPAATPAAPGQREAGRASGQAHRICDPAYLHGRAQVGLEVREILLVRRARGDIVPIAAGLYRPGLLQLAAVGTAS
jgi:hypothetical protein